MSIVELRPAKSQDTSSALLPVSAWDFVSTTMVGDQIVETKIERGDTYPTTGDPTRIQTSNLNEFIAFVLSLVPEVECVHTAFRENHVFYVWIVISEWKKEVRQRIYERQQSIIDQFPTFAFDFYIVSRDGQRVEDLISQTIDVAYVRPKDS
ncbi:MAG: hypothetical protein HYX73_06250 [Acidobacteria bacterium]|nr:hypothetical protein [Acidobacteriota bacterium]